ncbi:ribonuclease P protein component [Candidatus Peregrinibacteria bacterium]|nr:ribonuclease P protein component [Candidatus Peregrinibacteria bacterium]
MLKQNLKVPRQYIAFILKKGHESISQLFIARYKKNEEHFSRYRVIISKKLHPKAVNRNRLRRQVYEAIRKNLSQNQSNFDIILIPKKNILNKSYQEIEKDISSNILNLKEKTEL